MKSKEFDKTVVISPVPARVRREMYHLLGSDIQNDASSTPTAHLAGLILLFRNTTNPSQIQSPPVSRVSDANRAYGGLDSFYRVELQQFRLTTRISPKKPVGQLTVTAEDGESVVINLPLYRYLCMHALVMRSIEASSTLLSKDALGAVRCTRDDLERMFFQFGERHHFVQASEMAAPQIVDFVQLTKSELKKFGVHHLIAGRLNTGFYLDTLPRNIAFLPSAAPWLDEFE